LEIAKISVLAAERVYGLEKLKRDNPLSYVIEAKEKLKPKTGGFQ
jgi:hypothetical protein